MKLESNKYNNLFYNHFERKSYLTPPEYSFEENFLMRYKAKFEYYDTFENNLTIIYAKRGAGGFYKPDNKLPCRDNKFMVLNKSDGWEYINEDNQFIDILSFGISADFDAQFKYYLQSQLNDLLDMPFGRDVQDCQFLEMSLDSDYFSTGILLKNIYDCSMTEGYQFLYAEELTTEVLKAAYREQFLASRKLQNIKVQKRTTKEETLKRLIVAYEFIQDNIDRPITAQELSSVSCLSKFHLYDSFRAIFGKTPHQFINNVKLQKAMLILKTESSSVGEVCDNLGFNDISSFSKLFKKKYGKSPSYFMN